VESNKQENHIKKCIYLYTYILIYMYTHTIKILYMCVCICIHVYTYRRFLLIDRAAWNILDNAHCCPRCPRCLRRRLCARPLGRAHWRDIPQPGHSWLKLTISFAYTLQHAATHCKTREMPDEVCNTVQLTATRWHTLQQSATHCNALHVVDFFSTERGKKDQN